MAGPASAVFEPYVPRVAVDWMTTAPEERWQCIDGSLVFVDVSGFTALSERLGQKGRIGAEELTEVINHCFAELLAAAYAQQGGLLKFGGDALLLLFHDNGHAARACQAANEMRATLRTAGRLRTSVGSVQLRMSVGIHSGPVHLFRVGRSHRELMITGPTATTTVSLEHEADAGEILISPATAAAIDPRLVGDERTPGHLLRARALEVDDGLVPTRQALTVDLSDAIPHALREHLAAGLLESEHRSVAIAFVHFDGTDEILQRRGPDLLADALEELVAETQDAADMAGVTFLGSDIDADGGKIILVAGAPRAGDDDDGRLLLACRRLVDRTHALPVRIGVNRGPVFAGEVGPRYRRTYTVMGDAVNLAARVMARAEPGQVLATGAVLELSRAAFTTTRLPPFHVKGKAEPVEAYEVGEQQAGRHDATTSEVPFTGRERELAALGTLADRTREAHGAAVEIVGDVGIGKSRLIEEFRGRVDDMQAVTVRCEPYESVTPFYAARQLLAPLVSASAEAPDASTLTERMAEVAPSLIEWAPLIGAVLDIDIPDTPETSDLDERFRRERTNQVAADLAAAALTDPTLIVIEDAHWMDDASADLFRQFERRIPKLPWLMCVTRRDDDAGYQPGRAEILQLEPLPDDEAATLLASATAEAPLAPHEALGLLQRAGGNPLFLLEMAATEAAGVDDLPESIEGVMAVRIDQLPAAERRLLRYAAVLGSVFDPDVLAEVAEEAAAPEATGRLHPLVVADSDGRLRFRSQLLRDVAYTTLPFKQRRELHGRAADAIERRTGDDVAERAGILSLHHHHAERYELAWRYARIAAARAQRLYANVEAVELYDRAITAAQHLADVDKRELAEAWELLGDVTDLVGMRERAMEAYRSARSLAAGDPVRLSHLYRKQARVAHRLGGPVAAVRWINRGLRALGKSNDIEHARARGALYVLYSWIRHSQGRPKEAVDLALRAREDALKTGDRRILAYAGTFLDSAYVALGRPQDAVHAAEAIDIFEELGLFQDLAVVLNNLGTQAYYRGRWEEALELYARGRRANERAGNLVDTGYAAFNIAEILIDQGRIDEAEGVLSDLRQLWRSAGFESGRVFVEDLAGRVALRAGDSVSALEHLADARAGLEAAGMTVQVLVVDGWRADCLLRLGDAEEAAKLIEEALNRDRAVGGTGAGPMLLRLRGYAQMATGDLEAAEATVRESLDLARAREARYQTALSLEALSELARVRAAPPNASEEAERSGLLAQLGVVTTPTPPVTGVVAGGGTA